MGIFRAGFVVVFAGVLVVGNGNRCSSKTDIERYDPSDNSKYECWPAPDCHDGQESSVEPGSTHPKGTSIDCKPCQEGVSYSNRETNYRCRKCTTCGNKVVRLTCTIFRDRLCDNHCISTEFYLNATDDECYPCTECCGANDTNIELQCLSSKTVHIGSVIGEKGALHCKVLSSQQCDELLQNNDTSTSGLNDTSTSVLNDTSGLEKKCNGTEDNDSSNNNSSSVFKEKCTCSWSLDSLHRILIGGVVFMAFVCVVLIYFCKRERKMRSRRNDYFPSSGSCSCFATSCSAGRRCRGHCDMSRLIPFSEKLKVIPEEVMLDSLIPYVVKEHIKKLDAKKRLAKTWYDVGRKLEMSEDDLNLIKREDNREDGSPTSVLLDNLSTWEDVISLRRFVQVLHDLKRNDIANPIIEYYKRKATTSETNV